MANKKSSTPKAKKVRATKYTKLASHLTKELDAKKKALVRAEKTLAKAQASHQGLLSEVARLDMLERSLRAVNEKTAPPQNIQYVYTYPQWVWAPNYWNGYTYTPNQSPSWTFTNTPNLSGGQCDLTSGSQNGFNCGSVVTGGGNNWTLTTTLANPVDNACIFNSNVGDGSLLTANAGSLSFTGMGGLGDTESKVFTNFTGTSSGAFTVDLTTNATLEDSAKQEETEEEKAFATPTL